MSQLTQVVHQFARALEMRRQVDVILFFLFFQGI